MTTQNPEQNPTPLPYEFSEATKARIRSLMDEGGRADDARQDAAAEAAYEEWETVERAHRAEVATLQERLEAAGTRIEALKAEVVRERAAAERSHRLYREFVGDPKKVGRDEALAENERIYDAVMQLRADLGIENEGGNFGLLNPVRSEIERLRHELASQERVEDELSNARRAAEYDAARAESAERLNGELVAALQRIATDIHDDVADLGVIERVAVDALARIESASAKEEPTND